MRRRTGGIHKGCIALQLLDHLLVFLVGLHTGNAEGDNLHAAQVAPLGGQLFIERICQLQRMAGQSGVADAHLTDLCERRLERGQQLGFHLACDILGLIVLADVAADVGVEQQRILQPDAVLTEAADTNIEIDARTLIHYAEGNRTGGAVLVARQLLGIKVVDALILGCFAAEGKALADVLEHALHAVAQIAGKDTRLGGHIIGVLARLGTYIDHLALLHDEHALSVCNGDQGAVGDDIVIALCVAGSARGLFPALYCQHVRGDGLTIKVFLPLVGHHAACCAQCRFDKSHNLRLLFYLSQRRALKAAAALP